MAIIWVGTGRFNAYIGPVQDYIDRVVAADVAAGNTLGLEVGVRDAYDVFIRDSINVGHLGTSGGVLSQSNSIIKAAPIMAGARTLAGALVPLVGTAPTNFNFVAGDYNRKTGLIGNGSTKYLNSNRNNNVDPQDSQHMSVHMSTVPTTGVSLIGGGVSANGASGVLLSASRSRNTTGVNYPAAATAGLVGISRGASGSYIQRVNSGSTTVTQASQTPLSVNVTLFARIDVDTQVKLHTNARLAFYYIGESLDLALLDARVTTLINTFGAVIP